MLLPFITRGGITIGSASRAPRTGAKGGTTPYCMTHIDSAGELVTQRPLSEQRQNCGQAFALAYEARQPHK